MKKINIFILFLSISLSINSNLLFAIAQEGESTTPQEGKFARFKKSVTSFVKSLPQEAKKKATALNYDELDSLDFTFPMIFGQRRILFGLRWDWEKGCGDVSTGFTSFPGELVSPSLGDLGILPSATPEHILRIRLLNVLLGVGSKTERDIARAEIIKKIADPLRNILGQKFLTTLQSILVLKPIYVFYIKLILLSKTYLPQKRFKEIANQIKFLLMRLMQTVNVKATIAANNGEKNPRKWTKRVFYSDPAEFVDVLPGFIKDFLNDINAPVPLDSYQEWQDKKSGLTDYDKQISETMRRASIDSEVKYAKENIQPMLAETPLTLTDAKMLSYLCARFVYNQSKAKRNDTTLFMGKFISEVVKAIKKINTTDNTYKESLITKLNGYIKLLASKGNLAEQPVVDDFAIPGKKEIKIVSALAYYIYALKSNMSYPFYGDPGYLYMDAKLGKNSTMTNAFRILFRVFKDSRKAVGETVRGNIEIEGQTYKDIVGMPGTFDPRTGEETKAGSGPLFDYQKASIEYKKASSILKQATAKLPKGDTRLVEYRNKRDVARKAQLKAKKNLMLAKNKFTLLVIRYFEFKRAKELDPETEMKFLLREFKRLSMRSDDLMPLINTINVAARELLGFDLLSTEDLDKEPDFDEAPLLLEEEFDYDDTGGDFGEEQFAF